MTTQHSGRDGARASDGLEPDPSLPPVALTEEQLGQDAARKRGPKTVVWVLVGVVGAIGWTMLALARGETVNAIWFVFAGVATSLLGYRFYSKFVEHVIAKPDDRRATPAEYRANGKDYVVTDRRVLFGHHFAAIAGAGPLVGPVLAAQWGFLPGTIWIIVGVIFAGAVQDYLVLFFSTRRGGRSLGQMAKDQLGRVGGIAAIIAT
ncbi:carbon starvation CstA family protein, partial [Leucobacter sp. M11]|uniref:carbon starvation CstA family protein n=1 Tax=Leucobacter sp. M11 TaxID=2993565 RepID=UPI002D80BE76